MNASRPLLKILLTLVVALACAGMTALGFWQLARGQAKQRLLDGEARAATSAPQPLAALGAAGQGVRPAFAEGRYAAEPGLLLDGQSHARTPGVAAWNVFELADGSRVLVNRGWLPQVQGAAPPLPAAPAASRIEGGWRALPAPGMRLSAQVSLCAPGVARPVLVSYPTIAELRCLYGPKLREGLLDLAPNSAGAFTPMPLAAAAQAVPPSRHYGYAAQWWAFAATLAVLSFKLSRRKS